MSAEKNFVKDHVQGTNVIASNDIQLVNGYLTSKPRTTQVSTSSNNNIPTPPAGVDWIEIDACVNGVAMKMKILGTQPY